MNKVRANVARELASLASELAGPMPGAASADGWTPAIWKKWAVFFVELHAEVLASKPVSSASIARALDFDGVIRGPILERAAAVSNALRTLDGNA